MVAGDVVSGIGAAGAAIIFQPAAGVEVMITAIFWDVGSGYIQITNGALTTAGTLHATNRIQGNTMGMKILINNTNYLSIPAFAGASHGYTGIQTK